MKLYKLLLVLPFLSGCTFDESSYFVRFWNGNIPPTLSETEKRIKAECNKETAHLPYRNHEEAKEATREFDKCLIRKKKELGIWKESKY